jgi:hypothetical protein
VPVTQLYCEGAAAGTDIRIISQIAPRGCVVKAIGSKNRLAEAVIADRRIVPSLAGLVDRDFDCVQGAINQQPIPLLESATQVGWSWERKEIENYLLDPSVVEQACIPKYGFTLEQYQRALQQAAEDLKFYTAARTALSCCGFKDRWGSSIENVFSANYSFPGKLERQACQVKIEEIVNRGKGNRIVTAANVIQKFDEILPQFITSGHRLSHPLVYFSGKDLLLAMKPSLNIWLPNPQRSIQTFTERVVKQLERAEDVWTWLPEWSALHELLKTTDCSSDNF